MGVWPYAASDQLYGYSKSGFHAARGAGRQMVDEYGRMMSEMGTTFKVEPGRCWE